MTKGGISIWRRIRRHTATVMAWFLVLLALGVAGLWVDANHATSISYTGVSRQRNKIRTIHVYSGMQAIIVWYQSFERPSDKRDDADCGWQPHRDNKEAWVSRFLMGAKERFRYRFGFDRWDFSRARGSDSDGTICWVTFPHWFILLLLLPWPAKRGWGWLKLRRRRRKGLCVNCGYDLRASPERCPECGITRSGNDEIRNSNDERMPKHE